MFNSLLRLMKEDILCLSNYKIESLEDSSKYNYQVIDWGLRALNVCDTWKETKGKGVKVALLDTGITAFHQDLVSSVSKYKNFTSEDTEDTSDYVGHGTHCAGIIRANDNSIGVVGVAPKCELLVGKVLDDQGRGRISWITEGIRWAVDQGAHIISMSLGGPTSDYRMQEAVDYALDNNVIIIAAAGNEGEGKNTVGFPGAYPGVITVGSINRSMKRSTYSSTGPSLEIMAPGEDVLSCFPKNKYARLSGTSMACPFIAGVAALILSYDMSNGFDIKNHENTNATEYMTAVLTECATDIENEGFDNETGWGIVDPKASLHFKNESEN